MESFIRNVKLRPFLSISDQPLYCIKERVLVYWILGCTGACFGTLSYDIIDSYRLPIE